jgi:hypothetical protein
MATLNPAYGTYAALTVTNLQSLANDSTDPFGAWQSDRVDNRTTLADDYEVRIHLPTANTAPGNDSAAYVYVIPWVHDGSAWAAGGNFGTTTLPTGSEATASISDPNSMRLGAVLPYKTAQQILQGYVSVASLFGGNVPDGWSVAIRNCTGAALSVGCVVAYRPVTYTVG